MKKIISILEKNFNIIINVFFILAFIVLSSHIIGEGINIDQSIYSITYLWFSKISNVVFSLCSLLISLYLLVKEKKIWIIIVRILFLMISLFYLIITINYFKENDLYGFNIKTTELFLSIFISVLSFSYKITGLAHSTLHPSLLFVLSFGMIIWIGSFLLMLPASTHKGISYIDALFTATSAVTVTGLITLSTSDDFTHFGQIVIIILIQCGGLGILTFSNLFALIFKSDSSFKSRILLGGLINESNSSDIFKTLFKIIMFTIIVEILGAIFIYISIYDLENYDLVFFSLFHSVSAFCNAGFSIFPNGLFDEAVKFNYILQIIICWLIITGGMGYKVMINHYFILKYKIIEIYYFIRKIKNNKRNFSINRISLGTILAVRTTFFLLIIGTILFLMFEYNNSTLQEHKSLFGKIIVSFFNAVTPRTAGFNNIDMALLTVPSILIISFLMWIGASSGSTGGGIKTSTFAIAILGLFNHIKGKDRITLKWKEIPNTTLNLVNSTIILSIFALSLGVILLTIFEPKKEPISIFFEVVSAYSTSGLSLGITPSLTIPSKIVLIIIMFLGRVSFLTFLIGMYRQFFKEERFQNRIYPKEKVFI